MPSSFVLFSNPASYASCADFCNDDAIGSSVNDRFLNAAVITSSFNGLPLILAMPSFVTFCASAGLLKNNRTPKLSYKKFKHFTKMQGKSGHHHHHHHHRHHHHSR